MQKLEQVQTKEYIAGILRKEILSGRLAPGEELAQEKLAELLGVSRMPVREALQTLEAEGFLERMSNRHMKVVELDERRIKENFFFLTQAEASVLKLLRQQAEGEETRMEAAQKAFEEGASGGELSFHLRLANLLDNGYLRKTFGRLLGGCGAYVMQEISHPVSPLLAELRTPWMEGDMAEVSALLDRYYEELAECLLRVFTENIDSPEAEMADGGTGLL